MSNFSAETPLDGITTFVKKVEKIFESYHDWFIKSQKNIVSILLGVADVSTWCKATEKLAETQIIFTDDLTIEFSETICSSNNVDNTIQHYYFENDNDRMNMLIYRCRQATQLSKYQELYTQIIDAYQINHYQLACIGMFSIIDGVLSDVSQMNSTNFEKRIESVKEKIDSEIELNEIDRKTLCIYNSINPSKKSIFGYSDFSKPEPDLLNRHWILHGRTRKEYTKYDFLKILLCLDAIIFLANIDSKNN